MAEQFARERLIRFSHCDPAGIVYFVNFFDMVGAVVEDWFRDAVGLPFQEMHLVERQADRIAKPVLDHAADHVEEIHEVHDPGGIAVREADQPLARERLPH